MKIIRTIICVIILLTGTKLFAQRSYLYLEEDTCSSCGQQIIGSTMYGQKMRGYTVDYLPHYFCVHRDSLVFTIPDSRIAFGSHGSYKYRTRFKIKLPVHLQETFLSVPTEFTFNFPESENVVIAINNYTKGPQIDSSCTPDAGYINHFVRHNHFLSDLDTSPMANRICEVFFRNGQAILLLNIKQENYDRFLEAVNSFRIIDHGAWVITK